MKEAIQTYRKEGRKREGREVKEYRKKGVQEGIQEYRKEGK